MRYYIADPHFHHERLNQYMDRRGFETVEAMDEYMIEKWNAKVRKNDEVVILGDFCISPAGNEVNTLLKRLQGKKYLILGNHDKFVKSRRFDPALFGWIEPYKEVNDNNRKVILSHYPVFCYNGQYRRNAEGDPKTYMLYGHVHNTFDEYLVDSFVKKTREHRRSVFGSGELQEIPCQMINCFCMFSDYEPLTLDEWIQKDRVRRENLRREDFEEKADYCLSSALMISRR